MAQTRVPAAARRAGSESPLPPPVPSPRWKRVGFQGADPFTDLRSARLAGLLYACRLVESEPRAAEAASGSASALPFAAISMNVLFALRCHLALLDSAPTFCPCCSTRVRAELAQAAAQPHQGRHLRGFSKLLAADPDALFHLYATVCLSVLQAWEATFGAGGGRSKGEASEGGGDMRLMSFPKLLAGSIKQLMRELAGGPRSCAVVRARVLDR